LYVCVCHEYNDKIVIKNAFKSLYIMERSMSDQTGVVLVLIVLKLDLQLPMQSVPITTNVGSNTTRGKVYLVQHYVIKFVSVLRQVGGFLRHTLVSSTNKTESHDITGILLKVALNTIIPLIQIKLNLLS
jgi:hypothetical protein